MTGFALAVIAAACPDAALARAEYQGEVTGILAERSVAILAGEPAAQKFLSKGAEFSLIIGDVGGVLGRGISGAKELSRKLDAAKYEYWVWTSIPMPGNPCGNQKVEVRFFDKSDQSGVAVTFEYTSGQLIKAEGWTVGRVVHPFPKMMKSNG